MTRAQANLVLLLAAAIWGGGFVAQFSAAHAMAPLWFIGFRFRVATLAVLPFVVWEARKAPRSLDTRQKRLFFFAGLSLFAGSTAQQYGLMVTTVTNSSFITSLYVIFVPLIAVFILRRPPHRIIWPASIMALIGIYLLSGGGRLVLNTGDLLTVICALFWSIQIILTGLAAAESGRPLLLAATQFAVVSVCAFALALPTAPISFAAIGMTFKEILYLGIFSSGLAFALQMIGQRFTTPSQAALFLSSEALFGAFFAAILLGEKITIIGYIGAALMFAAILLVEIVPALQSRSSAPVAS